MYDDAYMHVDIQRITLNASCMTISGGRTKQLDIFCRITGFTLVQSTCGSETLRRLFGCSILTNFSVN